MCILYTVTVNAPGRFDTIESNVGLFHDFSVLAGVVQDQPREIVPVWLTIDIQKDLCQHAKEAHDEMRLSTPQRDKIV